jgi:hypothetical protein
MNMYLSLSVSVSRSLSLSIFRQGLSHYVAQTGLKFEVAFLLQPPEVGITGVYPHTWLIISMNLLKTNNPIYTCSLLFINN